MMKPIKPLKGANIKMQQQWGNMSVGQKAISRILNKDSDRDGVPNRWDCQPNNPFKQERRRWQAWKGSAHQYSTSRYDQEEIYWYRNQLAHAVFNLMYVRLNDEQKNYINNMLDKKFKNEKEYENFVVFYDEKNQRDNYRVYKQFIKRYNAYKYERNLSRFTKFTTEYDPKLRYRDLYAKLEEVIYNL